VPVENDAPLGPDDVLAGPVLDAFAETTRHLYVSDDLDEVLGRVTATATGTIDGCDVASLTMREGGRLVTRAPTGDLALRADELQYEVGQGPCLDAATSQGALIHTPDSANDDRWPKFSPRAAQECGVGGMLSCQLAVTTPAGRQALGGLNLYATRPNSFTASDLMLATLYSAHAAVIIDAARRQIQLREAIASRDVIGQAKGILMAQGGLDSDDAFDQLRTASQRLNVKLRDLAADVVSRRRQSGRPPSA
jgi:GAF domain-containing protein